MAERAVILLAEDSEDDVLLIKHAFAHAGIRNPLFVVYNGEEAIAYLKGEGPFSNRAEYPLPDLLLLDLKMPRVNGFEVIKWVRSEPGISTLCIVVLTSSDQVHDVNYAYALGANSFLVKPRDLRDFIFLTKIINEFWLHSNRPPEAFNHPGSKTDESEPKPFHEMKKN